MQTVRPIRKPRPTKLRVSSRPPRTTFDRYTQEERGRALAVLDVVGDSPAGRKTVARIMNVPRRYPYRWKRNPDLVSPEVRERTRWELASLLESTFRSYGVVLSSDAALEAAKADPGMAASVMEKIFKIRQLLVGEPTEHHRETLMGFLATAKFSPHEEAAAE